MSLMPSARYDSTTVKQDKRLIGGSSLTGSLIDDRNPSVIIVHLPARQSQAGILWNTIV